MRLALLGIVLAGLLLRVLVLATAENCLDADESLVALMGLDILEGQALPFFVYRTTYDGGGAVEAYLSAVGYGVFGVSPLVPKAAVLLVWLGAALLFAQLCRRHLTPSASVLAVGLFAVGTPFFLEWSLKARGGYVETLGLGLLLLILPDLARLRGRPLALGLCFGLVTGVGLWVSEMLLPLAAGPLIWLFARCPRSGRRALAAGLAAGFFAGLLPLVAYNLTHAGAHLRTSVVARLLGDSGPPLSLHQLEQSVRFVLGPGWPLALAALGLAAWRLRRPPLRLEHIFLLTFVGYVLGYWLSGLRYLSIPPSRVLFQVQPAASVLAATALAALFARRGAARGVGALALAAWMASVAVPTANWIASGEPREAGSWRGGWSLVDARALLAELQRREVDGVFTSYWTLWPLRFEARRQARQETGFRMPLLSDALPPRPLPPGRTVAFVLHPDTPSLFQVERALRAGGTHYRRSRWNQYVILDEIPSAEVHVGAGFPVSLVRDALPRPAQVPDGFN